MDNLELYNRVRAVPEEARKTIDGGRLSGMTDINPMWRIRKLTEEFGPCGVGWKTTEIRYETIPADGLLAVKCTLHLQIKTGQEWSEPIFGVGGSMLVAKERSGKYVDDEAYKKAYTDAISVACKALGFGADVYWDKDPTKYTQPAQNPSPPTAEETKYMLELIGKCAEVRQFSLQYVHTWLERNMKKKIPEFTQADVQLACKSLNEQIAIGAQTNA